MLYTRPSVSDILRSQIRPYLGNSGLTEQSGSIESLLFVTFSSDQDPPESLVVHFFRPEEIRSTLSIQGWLYRKRGHIYGFAFR